MPEGIKYAKDFQIPAEFPEILRNQPKDINKFACEYFEKLKQDRSLANLVTDD